MRKIIVAASAFTVAFLAACSAARQAQVTTALQVLCKVDAVAQPVAVAVADAAGNIAAASADQQLVHPAVVGACAAVGGTPVAVQAPGTTAGTAPPAPAAAPTTAPSS